jgi:ABC-type bacteriocin/lantibiotic exporter with double-glycine peptidase domain
MDMPSSEARVAPPKRHRDGATDENERAESLSATLSRAWRFRNYFLPFLAPAFGLLLLAFVEADLLYVSAVGMSRVVDGLAVELRARTTGLDSVAPASASTAQGSAPSGRSADVSGVGGSRLSLEPYLFTPLAPPGAGAPRLAIVMALFILVAEGVGLIREYLRSHLNERFRQRLQGDLLASLAYERAETRTRRQGGVTNEIFASDTAGLASLLIFGVVGIGESLVQAGKFSYEITRVGGLSVLLWVLALTIVMQGGLAQLFLRPEARTIERSNGLLMRFRALSMQLFDNMGRLVYFRGEQREIARVLELSAQANAANRRFMLLSSVRGSLSGLLTQLSFPLLVLLLLAFTATLVGPGQLIALERLVLVLASSVAALAATQAMLLQYAPGLARLEDVLAISKPEPEPSSLRPLRSSGLPLAVEFRELAFRYPGSTHPLLKDVNLVIPAGARVGIVGRSGCGKSTLARLLLGDVQPEAGCILLGNVDVTTWHLWWRRELIGFLPAEQGFLRGTIEENVLFGRARDEVIDLARAMELSGVARIITEQEASGDAVGAMLHNPTEQLSSGQRRRVGIARLLVGDQPVWVFDEPGSQLDPKSMLDVADAIGIAAKGHTTIIITHDPDVFVTDFNVLLRDGRIDDVGTHEELRLRNPHYFDLVNKNVADRLERGTGGVLAFPPPLAPPAGSPPGARSKVRVGATA